MKKLFTILAVSVFSLNAFADHTPDHKTGTHDHKTHEMKATDAKAATPAPTAAADKKAEMPLPPGVTPEQMAEAMKLGQPSDAHKKLEAFVGKWNYTGKFWMDPKGKPDGLSHPGAKTSI
jgi:hypothetical protein